MAMAARTCPHHDAVSIQPDKVGRKSEGCTVRSSAITCSGSGSDRTDPGPVWKTGRLDRRRFQQAGAEESQHSFGERTRTHRRRRRDHREASRSKSVEAQRGHHGRRRRCGRLGWSALLASASQSSPGVSTDESDPSDTGEFVSGIAEGDTPYAEARMSATSVLLVGDTNEVLGVCWIGDAQQRSEFYRDRPSQAYHLGGVLFDVPGEVGRPDKFGRGHQDQVVRLIGPVTNAEIPAQRRPIQSSTWITPQDSPMAARSW